MKKSIVIPLLLVFISVFSCVDEVKLKLRQESKKIVIEGLLSDTKNSQFIRLSFTNPPTNLEAIEPVQGAFVEVIDNENKKVVFRPIPNEIGIYKPEDENFVGIAGKSYQLYIKLNDGKEYKSALQKMPTTVPVDNINAVFDATGPYGFKIDIDFTDPSGVRNYYRWKTSGYHQRQAKGVELGFGAKCCERCWVLKEDNSIRLYSDVITDGGKVKAIPVFFSPFYLVGKNFIEVKQLSISKEAYQFWARYDDQIKRSGTIFDPLPAAIYGNVSNINDAKDVMLGFFEVAAISTKRITPIAESELGLLSFNIMSSEFAKPNGDCMQAFPNATYFEYNPPGW